MSPKSLKAKERDVRRKNEEIANMSSEEYAAKEIELCYEYVFGVFFLFKSNYRCIPILSQTFEITRKKVKYIF